MHTTQPEENIPLEIGGKTLQLRVTLPILRQLKTVTGKDVFHDGDFMKGVTIANLQNVIFTLAGSPADSQPTWIEEQLTRATILRAFAAIGKCLSMGAEADDENPSQTP